MTICKCFVRRAIRANRTNNPLSQKRLTIIIPFCFLDSRIIYYVETRNLRVLLTIMLPMMDNNLTTADAQIARLYNNNLLRNNPLSQKRYKIIIPFCFLDSRIIYYVETRNLRVLLTIMLPIMDNNLIKADAQIARLYNNNLLRNNPLSQKRNKITLPFCFLDSRIIYYVETRNLRVLLTIMLPIMDNNLTTADAQIARLYNNNLLRNNPLSQKRNKITPPFVF